MKLIIVYTADYTKKFRVENTRNCVKYIVGTQGTIWNELLVVPISKNR